MRTRIVLAAATLSVAAGQAFAGDAPQMPWPELTAPFSTGTVEKGFHPALISGDAQVYWADLEPARRDLPATPATASTATEQDTLSIGPDQQYPWPELDNALNRV